MYYHLYIMHDNLLLNSYFKNPTYILASEHELARLLVSLCSEALSIFWVKVNNLYLS